MLRTELSVQLVRLRTLIVMAFLAGVPVVAGLTTASHAGHRNGPQGGLFGASTFSALNHAIASLAFMVPLLVPLLVALLATAVGSADRDWGTLRYLYVQPVSRTRLLTGKLVAVLALTAITIGCVLAAGVLAGLILFGWHPFHIIGAPSLSLGDALARALAASGYTLLCMLSMAAIAFTLSLLLPRSAEALGASLAFLIVASILNGHSSLRLLNSLLPVHYWQLWTSLFDATHSAGLPAGIVTQLAWIILMSAAAVVVVLRRDPAA